MARSAYQQFCSDFSKGRAGADFGSNRGLWREAAAAWRAEKARRGVRTGASTRAMARPRRNPDRPVRDNPKPLVNPLVVAIAGVGTYMLVPEVKTAVDNGWTQLKAQLSRFGAQPG